MGAPQLGHEATLVETSFLQSEHIINPILVASC
jgi:hypothetical protein